MAEPILPLYEAMKTAASGLAAAQKSFDDAKAALLAAMPEHVEFSTTPDPPPVVKRIGNEIVAVTKPYLGLPYTETSP